MNWCLDLWERVIFGVKIIYFRCENMMRILEVFGVGWLCKKLVLCIGLEVANFCVFYLELRSIKKGGDLF